VSKPGIKNFANFFWQVAGENGFSRGLILHSKHAVVRQRIIRITRHEQHLCLGKLILYLIVESLPLICGMITSVMTKIIFWIL